MASSNPIIVGGGINSGAPFTLGHLTYISNVTPPQISSYEPVRALDGAVVYTGIPDAAGTYPTVAGANETFRTLGGIISEFVGATDSFVAGRGATANAGSTGAVVIGATATMGVGFDRPVVIGWAANAGGNAGVLIGRNSSKVAASGVVIGDFAALSGSGAGSDGVIIGDSAILLGGTGGLPGGVVIGNGARAAHPDSVVIGSLANASFASNNAQGNVLIGNGAGIATTGTGIAVVVGGSAGTAQVRSVVIGQAASATDATKSGAVIVGQGSVTSGADSIVIGRQSTAANAAEVIIGGGASAIGANTLQLGTPATMLSTFVLGEGDTKATPITRLIRFTNASGTDNAAGTVSIMAPLSTGNATPASLAFMVGQQVAGSSNVLQTAGNGLVLSHTTAGGHLGLFANDVEVTRRVGIGGAVVATTGLNVIHASPQIRLDGKAAGVRAGLEMDSATATNGQIEFKVNSATKAYVYHLAATNVINLNIQGGSNVAVGATTVTLGVAASAYTVIIDGTGFGAGVASLRFNGLTDGAGAGAGTILNTPNAAGGNPAFWLPVNIAGTVRYIPCWSA